MQVLSVRSEKLFSTVRVIVYCLKMIGLAPFSVRIVRPGPINPHNCRIQAFGFSKIGLTYNIILSIPVVVLPVIWEPTPFVEVNSDNSSISGILSVISRGEDYFHLFCSCLIIISWAFRQKSAVCIMNKLLEVDVCLSGLKQQPFNRRALIFLALHILLNTFLWITYPVLVTINSKHGNLLIEFFGRLSGIIIYWFITEYFTIVGIVSQDLETVNKYLLDFKQFGNYLSRPPVRHGILIVNVSNHFSSQLASLKVLHSVRTTLFELCRDISDFFSLPILFCIACCFVPVFEKLYKMSQNANPNSLGFTVCFTLVFVLKFIYPVVVLTSNVTRTKKEAELTGQIVNKLLVVARTDDIKIELENFSHQLLHEKVDFTAHGLFSLDSTLLHSMLGGVATYAIILMQFGASDCNHNCNCNCNCNDTYA